MSNKVSSLIVLAAASIALTFGVVGCNKTNTPDNSAQSQPAQTDPSQNPADTANLAPTDGTQATATNDQQQPATQATQQNYQQQQPRRRRRSVNLRNSGACEPCDNGYQDTSYGLSLIHISEPTRLGMI